MTVGVFMYLVPIYGVGNREKKKSISMEFRIFSYHTSAPDHHSMVNNRYDYFSETELCYGIV